MAKFSRCLAVESLSGKGVSQNGALAKGEFQKIRVAVWGGVLKISYIQGVKEGLLFVESHAPLSLSLRNGRIL